MARDRMQLREAATRHGSILALSSSSGWANEAHLAGVDGALVGAENHVLDALAPHGKSGYGRQHRMAKQTHEIDPEIWHSSSNHCRDRWRALAGAARQEITCSVMPPPSTDAGLLAALAIAAASSAEICSSRRRAWTGQRVLRG